MSRRFRTPEVKKLLRAARAGSAAAIGDAIRQAQALQQAGRYDEGTDILREILKIHPTHIDALHTLSLLELQRGNRDESMRLIDKALNINPHSASGYTFRGNILLGMKNYAEALANYDHALTLLPNLPPVLCNRGAVLRELKRHEEALASFARAIELKSDYAEAFYGRAVVLHDLARLEEALASFNQAIALKGNYVEAFYRRASVLREMNRSEDALSDYGRAIALAPNHIRALNDRGNLLGELRRYNDAIPCYDRALEIKPDYIDAMINRGITLLKAQFYPEALADFDRAVMLKPDHPAAHSNRGTALRNLNRLEEALASCDRALELKPDFSEALYNRGYVLQEMNRLDQALTSFEMALSLTPDYADAHFAHSLCLLLLGKFSQGWQEYEWRWKISTAEKPRTFPRPLWLGQEDIAGRSILLHAEQGFGDTIQFCRYAILAAERGARVLLEVQPTLKPLLYGLKGPTEVIAEGDPLPGFDVHCPLMSLPLAFGTTLETIPNRTPYLSPDPEKVTTWRKRLGPMTAPAIGLAWSGRSSHMNDRNRSMRLATLLPLSQAGVKLISLQKEVRDHDFETLTSHPGILHYGNMLEDFTDTAALIQCLDMVISVDTAIAHLAGAMGKPVCILLPYAPEWRWLTDREDSPWYPSARLFRQHETGYWDTVIREVITYLSKLYN